MTTIDKHVVVIGGGLAGLASAVEIASLARRQGVRVSLFERNRHLGGKMNVLSDRGYTFDMGPTILTLPQVLRGIVRRAGRRVEDYIDLVNLDPQWRCHFEDGVVVDLRADVDAFAAAIDKQFPDAKPGAGYKQFVNFSRRMYGLSEKVFFYRDIGAMTDMMRKPPKDPSIMKDVLAMRMHSTVGSTIEKFVPEPHVRQICEHFLQYVGSSPFLAPAILSLIAAAQTDHGCWYSMPPANAEPNQRGGTRMVARALERLARELGVEVTTGVGVRRIVETSERVTGVELDDGRMVGCDAIVSNCDVQRTYRDLLGTAAAKGEQSKIARDYTPACSGVVLYLGLDKQYNHLAHHNFLFSKDSHQEFDDIYTKGIPARDPTIYLAAPSRSDPTQAPAGCESFYALIHTPYQRPGQTWEGPGGLMEQYRPVIIEKLKRFGMKDIEQRIVVEHHLTPQSIDRMYNAEGGAIYGLASHGRLKGGFKPRNTSRVFQGLYLTGGSANPGPGVPMVLMSGVTTARSVVADLGLEVPEIAMGQGVEPAASRPEVTTRSPQTGVGAAG